MAKKGDLAFRKTWSPFGTDRRPVYAVYLKFGANPNFLYGGYLGQVQRTNAPDSWKIVAVATALPQSLPTRLFWSRQAAGLEVARMYGV